YYFLSSSADLPLNYPSFPTRRSSDLAMLNEQLHGLTTIKGFQTERYETERLARQNAEYRVSVLRTEWWSSALIAVVFLTTGIGRSEEHTSELQSRVDLVCRLLPEKKN